MPQTMVTDKIRSIIQLGWMSYKNKVASELVEPENEKMMQLQLAQILQNIIPLFEYNQSESIKVLLEVPVVLLKNSQKRIIDIVILHSDSDTKTFFPIEIKCFREYTRDKTAKRGAQNLGMYDYWEDIENLEHYTKLPNFSFGTHLTLTDDGYYVNVRHRGRQVVVYSTNRTRENVSGLLSEPIKNRKGKIELRGNYSMNTWELKGSFNFINQEIGIL